MINLDYAIYRKLNRWSGPKVCGCPRTHLLLSLKLIFSGETDDLHTKMFMKSMNFPVKNLALVSLCIKNVNFKTENWFLIRNRRYWF